MYPFVETIRISEGIAERIPFHQKRMQETIQHFYHLYPQIDLADAIDPVIKDTYGIHKCRVVYTDKIDKIECMPYQRPTIHQVGIVINNELDYSYKSTDRRIFSQLRDAHSHFDDLLIVKKGMLTDSTFCNLALFDGKKWVTPLHPLLKGTRRAELLSRGILIEKEIPYKSIFDYEKISFINALNDLEELSLTITHLSVSLI